MLVYLDSFPSSPTRTGSSPMNCSSHYWRLQASSGACVPALSINYRQWPVEKGRWIIRTKASGILQQLCRRRSSTVGDKDNDIEPLTNQMPSDLRYPLIAPNSLHWEKLGLGLVFMSSYICFETHVTQSLSLTSLLKILPNGLVIFPLWLSTYFFGNRKLPSLRARSKIVLARAYSLVRKLKEMPHRKAVLETLREDLSNLFVIPW